MNDERLAGSAPAPDQAASSSPGAPAGWLPPPPPPLPAAMPGRRSKRALVAAAVAGALVAGAGIGVTVGLLTRGSSPTGATSPSSASAGAATGQARALYRQALAATRGSAGFHYVATSTGGAGTQTIVGDAGRIGGRQDISVDSAAGREQFSLLLVHGIVYFQGNAPALEDQLGVSAASAPGLQGKWVSVSNLDGPFSVVAPGITVADQAQETALIPTSTTPIRTIHGASATRIVGTVPPQQQGAPAGMGRLDIDASSHLPISYVSAVSVGGATATNTTTFSGWGAPSAPTAPAGAVAWSTLGAAAPPGGYGSDGGGVAPSATPQL